jgi:hypothetical protein
MRAECSWRPSVREFRDLHSIGAFLLCQQNFSFLPSRFLETELVGRWEFFRFCKIEERFVNGFCWLRSQSFFFI